MKAASNYFPPIMFSATRFLIGALVLFGIIFIKRIPLPKKGDWKWYAICGLLQTTYIYGVTQPAVKYVNAGVICILSFTMPFWLCILAHFLLPDERLNWNKGLGLILGIMGLFLVTNINPFSMQWNGLELIFEILVLLGAVAWAVANLIIKIKLKDNDKFQFTAYQMGIGALVLLLISAFFEPGQKVKWTGVSISSVFFAGVVASALAYVLWSYILTKVEASKASITLLLVPVVGILSVWLAFGEALNVKEVIGVVMVISGIAAVNAKITDQKQKKIKQKFTG